MIKFIENGIDYICYDKSYFENNIRLDGEIFHSNPLKDFSQLHYKVKCILCNKLLLSCNCLNCNKNERLIICNSCKISNDITLDIKHINKKLVANA